MTPPSENASPLVLKPGRLGALALAAVCAAFTAAGVWILRTHGDWIGWAATAMFGTCALIFGVAMLPGSSQLELWPDALVIKTMYRASRIRWRDIASFETGQVGPNKVVGIIYAPEYKPARTGRMIMAGMTGVEGALPNTFGMSAERLADLLNEELRKRRTSARSQGPA